MFEFVKYKIKEEREKKMGITLKEMVAKPKKLFLSIKEVKEAIEKTDSYASLYVSGNIDKKDLINELNIQYYSDIDGFFIGRVKNIFIFIGVDDKVNEYLNKCIVNAIECKRQMQIYHF